jgi:hypothetical protein
MRRRIHACNMRRRIHVLLVNQAVFAIATEIPKRSLPPGNRMHVSDIWGGGCMSVTYGEEDACQ